MTTPYLYYANPFGVSADDLTAIPTPAAIDGSVSYQNGWTPPYEKNLLTDPAALPIPRGQMNQLFFDITYNLQEYQQFGSPQWVVGNTVAYPIYARVYSGGFVYENQVASNTATPGADATWLKISGSANAVLPGMVMDWAGPVAPAGYLLADGSAVSRTTYAALLANITRTVTNATTVNTQPQVTNLTNATTTFYPGMHIESANFAGGTTVLTVDSATQVTMSTNATASGTANVTIQFFNWGNGNGTSTFNLPDLRNRTTVGEAGTLLNNPSSQGDIVGQTTGTATNTLAVGNIPKPTYTSSLARDATTSIGSFGSIAVNQGISALSQVDCLTIADNFSASPTPVSTIQPTAVMYKIIKT